MGPNLDVGFVMRVRARHVNAREIDSYDRHVLTASGMENTTLLTPHERNCYPVIGFRPWMTRISTVMMASTSRMWMSPPMV